MYAGRKVPRCHFGLTEFIEVVKTPASEMSVARSSAPIKKFFSFALRWPGAQTSLEPKVYFER